MSRYTLRGGKYGFDRLQLLHRDRWPDTERLFSRVGIAPGMHCVDLGCGGGPVTMELARLVAPTGRATGVDLDAEKLELARGVAAERGLTNVDFVVGDLSTWSADPGSYDLAFNRNVLQHLADPVDLLRRMWSAVRPGGVIAIEDADFDGVFSHPANEGLEFFVRSYGATVAKRGADASIGRKLFAHFHTAGIDGAEVAVVQSAHVRGDEKALMLSTLDATAASMVAEGVATDQEVAAARDSLAMFTDDPTTLVSGPRIVQIWARKPA